MDARLATYGAFWAGVLPSMRIIAARYASGTEALAENLRFTTIYSHFFAGDFIRATRPSQDIDFVELTLQAKF